MELDLSSLDRRAAYKALISLIIPRPIALVSTLNAAGRVNLAPFSYFNGVSSAPPIVSIAVGSKKAGRKDTWTNIERTGEFVINAVVPELMDGVIVAATEYPPDVSEMEIAKLEAAPSKKIGTPGVARSPIRMECTLYKIVEVEGSALILGRVVWVYVREDLWSDGRADPRKLTFVGRLGDDLYSLVDNFFERKREPHSPSGS